MNRLLTILTALSALLSAAPFARPRTQGGQTLLWLPKLLGGALSPAIGMTGALAALTGMVRRRWALVFPGLVTAGLAARYVAVQPNVEQELADLPGFSGQDRTASRTASPGGFQRDLVIGHAPESNQPLLADLWLPSSHPPSGLGLIYAHGSGWRVGDKDMFTRPFFRRLAGQGHLILDVAYSLWPTAGVPAMVTELNQAILWLKENGPTYGVDPHHIVLMGGSAGAHLALLAAYTPGNPAFRPQDGQGDTSVCAVVAFYPPVDLEDLQTEAVSSEASAQGLVHRTAMTMMRRLFAMPDEQGPGQYSFDPITDMLGGPPAAIPDTYRLLSPIHHVGPHCPPTLLLHGADDVFGLTPGVHRLQQALRQAGVPCALLEFPHTEHGFDLLLPQISPTARTAARAVEQFLAWRGVATETRRTQSV